MSPAIKIASRSVRFTIYHTTLRCYDRLIEAHATTGYYKGIHLYWLSRGGKLKVVDPPAKSTLLAALKSVKVVITAIHFDALEEQKGSQRRGRNM